MKPPSSNRFGGTGRPPSNRGPGRGPASGPQRGAGGPAGPVGPRGQQGQRKADQRGYRASGPQEAGQGARGTDRGPREADQGAQRPQGAGPPGRRDDRSPGPRQHDLRGAPAQKSGAPDQRAARVAGTRQTERGSHPHQPPNRSSAGAPDRAQRPYQDRPRGRPHLPADAARPAPDAPRGTVWLYGQHAIAAALANPARRLRRLLLTEDAEATLAERLPVPWALPVERVDRGRLDHLLGRDVTHQGAALLADPLAPPSLLHTLERPGPLLVLDQVTDPRNVGAILRAAAAFGAAGVIAQDRNAPEETGALAKAASGALETVPLLRAVNIARTLIALKAADIWCVGLDAAGPALSGAAFAGRRVALVLGAEGTGLRRLTRETCDEVAGLAMSGAMESLNVSAAAAVALYELTRRV